MCLGLSLLGNLALSALIGAAVYAQPTVIVVQDDYPKAVAAYKEGNYGQARQLLEPIVKTNPNLSQSAWLLLGHCYAQTGQVKAAKVAYQWAYNLNNRSNMGKNALALLSRLEGHPVDEKTSLVSTTTGADTSKSEDKPNPEFQKLYDQVVAKMPKIKPYESEKPSCVEMLTWSGPERLSCWDQVCARKNSAADAIDQFSRTLKHAKSVALSLLPNSKSFGETEEVFRKRKTIAQQKADELLKPYEERMKLLERNMLDASALYDSCFNIPITR